MNIISKVTREYMKKNRTRTIVTIIGVILSAAMFTSVTTLLSSAYYAGKNMMINEDGNYHINAMDTDGEKLSEYINDKRIESVFYAEKIGISESDSTNENKPYICVFGVDNNFLDNMHIKMLAGRLPQNNSEIVLPAHYLGYIDKEINVGDKITLAPGVRTTVDGYELYSSNPYDENDGEPETIANPQKKEYTVVGFCARPNFEDYQDPAFSAFTLGSGVNNGSKYNAFINFKIPVLSMNDFIKENKLSNYVSNWTVLAFSGMFKYNNLMVGMGGFAAVLIVIIFIGSVSLIYSAFSISVSERTKQFGLLSSVGATYKQIKKSVYYEALLIFAAGVPTGIVCGLAGIGITLHFVNGILGDWMGLDGGIGFRVTPFAIVCTVLISLVTVLVSAHIPAKRASRVTAIDAIRLSKDIKMPRKKRSRTTSKAFIKVFGVEGMLARKYFSRSRKKYMNTIIALSMSIILFVSAGYFTSALVSSVESTSGTRNYDIGLSFRDESDKFDAVYKSLSDIEEIDSFSMAAQDSFMYLYPQGDCTEEYNEYLKSVYGDSYDREALYASIVYIDDTSFNKILEKSNTAKDAYYDKENPKYVCLNRYTFTVYGSDEEKETNSRKKTEIDFLKNDVNKFTVISPSEDIENYYCVGLFRGGEKADSEELYWYYVKESEAANIVWDQYSRPENALVKPVKTEEISIGLKTNEALMGTYPDNENIFIRPYSTYTVDPENDFFRVFIKSDKYSIVQDKIEELIAKGKIPDCNIMKIAENEANERSIVTVVQIFAYGFITLISLISVANVFNTISNNISMRRRDYASLESMGMSGKGLIRMMNYECLIYGLNAIVTGVPISVIISLIIYKISDNMIDAGYVLPWQYILIAVICVFAVVFSSMLYSMQKVKKDNTIDALKNENV